MTALPAAGAGHSDAVSGAGVRGVQPVLLFRRPRRRNCGRLVHEGRIQFLAQFPSLAQPEMRRRLADPGDPATFERCKLDFGERPEPRGHLPDCTRTCCGCAARIRSFTRRSRGGVDGAVLAAGGIRAALFRRRTATTACCSSIWAATCDWTPRPNRCWRRRKSTLWEAGVVERRSALWRRRARRRWIAADGWRIPGHAAVVLRPAEHKGKWQI